MSTLKLGDDLINAVKEVILNTSYPVGRVIVSIDNVNPSTYLGGTWVAFGSGRTLVGVDSSQPEFNLVEKTGGEKKHLLSVAEMPIHSHSMDLAGWHEHFVGLTTGYGNNQNFFHVSGSGNVDHVPQKWNGGVAHGNGNHTHNIHNAGGNVSHNNLQPYITTYFWKRTA